MSGGDWKDMFRGVETNDLELVKYYVLKGIDINYQHPEFLTGPLFEAIRLERIEMIEYLLEQGADLNTPEGFGGPNAYALAKKLGNRQIIALLDKAKK